MVSEENIINEENLGPEADQMLQQSDDMYSSMTSLPQQQQQDMDLHNVYDDSTFSQYVEPQQIDFYNTSTGDKPVGSQRVLDHLGRF